VSDPRETSRLPAAAFVFVLLALNLAFGAASWGGGGSFAASLLIPSLDAAFLVLVAGLFAWLRLPGVKVLAGVLAGLGLFLLVFRTADSLVPLFFNRPLALHSDINYIPDLYALLRDTSSPWLFYPGVLLIGVLLAGAAYGLYRAFGLLQRALARPPYRYAAAGLTGVLLLLALTGVLPAARTTTLPRAAQELAGLARRGAYLEEQQRYFETRGRALEALAGSSTSGSPRLAEAAPGSPSSPGSQGPTQSVAAARPLSGLGGRDVLLFIVESYGYTLYSEPEHFEPIETSLREYEAALQRAGYGVVSAFLTSTAFGGNSWLADSTLTTGVRIDNQTAYELLLVSEVKPMARYFAEAGYRTVVAMPATTSAWPEGEFFGFEKKYYYRDFGYRGPNLKWAPTTDQYVLDAIHRREVAAAERPLFVQYVLISSHYPFNLIPRYFEDWSVIGDGSIYAREDSVTVLPIKPGSNTAGAEGYVASMRYELELITEYVTRFVSRDSLIVILGDHQPYSGITGRGKPWSVPIHVASREPELLEPFRRRGYTRGWIPRQPLPHPGMESFLPGLVEDFSSGSGRPGSDRRDLDLSAPDRAAPGGLAGRPDEDAS